jgi:hypothetical protein
LEKIAENCDHKIGFCLRAKANVGLDVVKYAAFTEKLIMLGLACRQDKCQGMIWLGRITDRETRQSCTDVHPWPKNETIFKPKKTRHSGIRSCGYLYTNRVIRPSNSAISLNSLVGSA